MANATLTWEQIPDTKDVRAYVRRRLREPRSS
jgi:hypothetical protein